MTAGEPVGPRNDDQLAPPEDTGEASACRRRSSPSRSGSGRACSSATARTASASRAQRPRRCVDDPAARPATCSSPSAPAATCACRRAQTTRRSRSTRCATSRGSAAGAVAMRWSQLGFGRTSTTSHAQATPRNLMGFKDGTNNIVGRGRRGAWTSSSGSATPTRPAWMRGGTYMVTRRIRDAARGLGPLLAAGPGADDRPRQGTRARRSAARRSSTRRTSTAQEAAASRVIPADAHVRLGAARTQRRRADPAARLLVHRRRRSSELGELDAGLFFICLPARPASASSSAIQRRLRRQRRAQRVHQAHRQRDVRGSARCEPGGFVGEGLFAST